MKDRLSSDSAFYFAVGAFVLAVFVIGMVALAVTMPGSIGTRELVGFVVGFVLFLFVYLVSIAVKRIEEKEGV